MTIGMIVATPEEIGEFFKTCGEPAGHESFTGYDIVKYNISGHEIYVAGSGAGELAAAATTQLLITKYGAQMIVNFGVVGGLTEEMSLSSTVVIEKVVHYDYDASPFMPQLLPGQYPGYGEVCVPADRKLLGLALEAAPELRAVTCASADKFISSPEAKRSLHERWKADICEMEAAGILITANRNGVPSLLIKAVSDSVSGGEQEYAAMVHEAAGVCVKVLLRVLGEIKD